MLACKPGPGPGWQVIEMLPKSNFEKYSYCLFWGISVVSGKWL
jgi:hypothetical protein